MFPNHQSPVPPVSISNNSLVLQVPLNSTFYLVLEKVYLLNHVWLVRVR